jgi:circadian clock protein KaiC
VLTGVPTFSGEAKTLMASQTDPDSSRG